MILEDFQWHTWPCPITVSKQFNLYKGRPAATSDTSPLSFKLKLPPALLRLHFVPNPNYVASNPARIPKSQISLRPTPTTTAGADNLTLLSFISLCGQTGTNYSRPPFSPHTFPPPLLFPLLCQLLSPHWHQPQTTSPGKYSFFPAKDNISGSKYWPTVLYFYCAGGKFLQVLPQSGRCLPVSCCTVNTSSARAHCHPHCCITALNL